MKIPTTTPDRYKTGEGLFSLPVPGQEALAFTPPPRDKALLSLRETADVERDLQEWSAFAAQWEEEFTASRKGTDARNAEQDARKMHEEFYETRRTAYAENPRSGRYLREEGSAIASRSIQNMADYTQAEDTRYIEGVLQNEEQNLRHTMASPDASDHERMQAFNSFAMKMSSWRTTRGESPEVTKQWRTAFAMDMGAEYLQARFQRSLDENPDTALTTIQAAQSLRNPSAQTQKSPAQTSSLAGKNSSITATLLTSSEGAPTARTTPESEVAEPSSIPHSDSDRDASGSTRENGIADAPKGATPTGSPVASTQGDTVSQRAPDVSPDRVSGGSSDVSPSMAQITAQEETHGAASANTTGSVLPGNLAPEDTQKHALIQSHAAEYARFFSSEQLAILHSQAQAHAQQRQLHIAEQRQNIQRDTQKILGKALKENDFTGFLQAHAALIALGDPKAAQNITSLHKAAKLAQPQLALLELHPLPQRRALATTLFEHHTLKNIDGGTAANTLQHWHEEKLRADEAFFQRDPAGFVANHPRLAQQGLTHEEFLQQQGISEQEYIERSLVQQLAIGANQGVAPKVLSTQQAADLKDQFTDCKTPRKKAEFLLNKTKEWGVYSGAALDEAGLPLPLAVFAGAFPRLAASDIETLVIASETHLKSIEETRIFHADARSKVAASPYLKSLHVMENTSGQATATTQIIAHTLESFVALGGNLQQLERAVQNAPKEEELSGETISAVQALRGTNTLHALFPQKKTQKFPAEDFLSEKEGQYFLPEDFADARETAQGVGAAAMRFDGANTSLEGTRVAGPAYMEEKPTPPVFDAALYGKEELSTDEGLTQAAQPLLHLTLGDLKRVTAVTETLEDAAVEALFKKVKEMQKKDNLDKAQTDYAYISLVFPEKYMDDYLALMDRIRYIRKTTNDKTLMDKAAEDFDALYSLEKTFSPAYQAMKEEYLSAWDAKLLTNDVAAQVKTIKENGKPPLAQVKELANYLSSTAGLPFTKIIFVSDGASDWAGHVEHTNPEVLVLNTEYFSGSLDEIREDLTTEGGISVFDKLLDTLYHEATHTLQVRFTANAAQLPEEVAHDIARLQRNQKMYLSLSMLERTSHYKTQPVERDAFHSGRRAENIKTFFSTPKKE